MNRRMICWSAVGLACCALMTRSTWSQQIRFEAFDEPPVLLGDDHLLTHAESIEQMVEQRRQHDSRLLAVRIDELRRICQLTDEQVKILEVAAKGAVEQSLTKWKQQLQAGQVQPMRLPPRIIDQAVPVVPALEAVEVFDALEAPLVDDAPVPVPDEPPVALPRPAAVPAEAAPPLPAEKPADEKPADEKPADEAPAGEARPTDEPAEPPTDDPEPDVPVEVPAPVPAAAVQGAQVAVDVAVVMQDLAPAAAFNEIAENIVVWGAAGRVRPAMPDTAVLSEPVWTKAVERVLTDQQRAAYEAAVEQRWTFQRRVALQQLIIQVDRQLFLDDEQRRELTDLALRVGEANLPKAQAARAAAHEPNTLTAFFHNLLISDEELDRELLELFSAPQWERWQDVKQGGLFNGHHHQHIQVWAMPQ